MCIRDSPNSVMIVASECREGVGSADTDRMLHDFDNAHDREVYTRENYTIGLNVAYFFTPVSYTHLFLFQLKYPK